MAIAYCLSQIEPKAALELQSEKEPTVFPRSERVSEVEYGWPMVAEDYLSLSSPFGKRSLDETGGYGDTFHDGVDMYGYYRARILAVADGIVLEHYPAPNGYFRGHPVLGGYLVVQHDGAVSRYAHLSKTYVHEGESVRGGQVIARQGGSGKTASPHLHFELELAGELVNPLGYIREELK